jgi:surface protein
MKKIILLIYILSLLSFSQTPITNSNLGSAISTCLSTNPVDGLCTSCEFGAIPDWDVSDVTNMDFAFYDTDFNGDISQWDVSNVTDMNFMFFSASYFNQNLNLWDVSNVTRMTSMFKDARSFNKDISNWDVSSVTRMGSMFKNARSFNKDISNWDVSNVISMFGLFYGATSFNQDISAWDVTSVTDMNIMFGDATSFNQNLNIWNVSSVTDMNSMFSSAKSFNQNLNLWDVSNVTNMSGMFYNATSFNKDISNWDVSSVTRMISMFRSATSFNKDISNWDVSNVTEVSSMFEYATSFNQNLSNWDVSSVTRMGSMFKDATSFNKDISNWDVSNVISMYYMFYRANSFNQDLSNWDVSSATAMTEILGDTKLSSENYDAILKSWSALNLQQNVDFRATNINYCTSQVERQSIRDNFGWRITDAGSECTTKVTDLNFTLAINTCLETNPIDGLCFDSEFGSMPDWNVSEVTNMSSAFKSKINFNQDISTWDVTSVTDMNEMFNAATSFNQDLSNWVIKSVTNMSSMFDNSGLSVQNYDSILKEWARLDTQEGVYFGASGINFCNGESPRQSLIDLSDWIITDAGLDCSTLSIENNNLSFSIYPNPTNSYLFIESNQKTVVISIYNLLGTKVISTNNTNKIDVKQLPKGIYIISISNGLNKTNKKFLKF